MTTAHETGPSVDQDAARAVAGAAGATGAEAERQAPITESGVLGMQQAAGNSGVVAALGGARPSAPSHVQRMFGLPFGGADPNPMALAQGAMNNPAGAATGMASQLGGGALGYGQGLGQGAINQYVPGPFQGLAGQGLGMLSGMAGGYMNQGIGMMGGAMGNAMGGMPGGSPMGMLGGLGSMLGGLF